MVEIKKNLEMKRLWHLFNNFTLFFSIVVQGSGSYVRATPPSKAAQQAVRPAMLLQRVGLRFFVHPARAVAVDVLNGARAAGVTMVVGCMVVRHVFK